MIVDLPNTTTRGINKSLVQMRERGGVVALGRVLTLIIATEDSTAETAIKAANDASREHPCRVLVIARGDKRGRDRLDAQVRIGGDAGASEVIVARLHGPLAGHGHSVVVPLLLPDAPTVTWWPQESPSNPSADPLGQLAQRRITDAAQHTNPTKALTTLADNYNPGDTDLAWTRITRWRAVLAAALDQEPYESVIEAAVAGASDSPSAELLAAWLAMTLKCPVKRKRLPRGEGIAGVVLTRKAGTVTLERTNGTMATLVLGDQAPRLVQLPRRLDRDCLAEELRRLDPDEIFADTLRHLPSVHTVRKQTT